MRLLAAGPDTLYWSARADVSEAVAALTERKHEAAASGDPLPWREVRGLALAVGPRGAHQYPVYVECPEFRIRLTESARLPSVYVELRSAFIHEVGVEAACAESRAVASEIVGQALPEPHASRIDLYADFADWRLIQPDRAGFVTHAGMTAHFRAGTDEYETVSVGKHPLMVRLYRKDIEVRRKGGHAPVFWNGWDGPVTRVEVEAWSKHLARFQLRTVADALASRGDIWRHATSGFFEMRVAGPGDREGWPLRTEWRAVQQVGAAAFPSSGVVPFHVVQGQVEVIEKALYGYATSYGAFLGLDDPRSVLDHLQRRVPEIARGRVFSTEVDRKRLSRVPRAVRLAAQ